MCYWKDKIIKSEINKTYGNRIWIKKIKTGENYAETIIAMSENVSTSNTAKLPNCQYNKSSMKTRSLRDKRDYLLLTYNA